MTVLIVDDEPELTEILSFYLEDEGFRVITVNTAQDALAKIDSDHVDAMVTDVRMPQMTGVELLKRMKAESRKQRPKVLIITGYSDVTAESASGQGADGFLAKPFSREAFMNELRRVIHGS